jgi:hypothetical protein
MPFSDADIAALRAHAEGWMKDQMLIFEPLDTTTPEGGIVQGWIEATDLYPEGLGYAPCQIKPILQRRVRDEIAPEAGGERQRTEATIQFRHDLVIDGTMKFLIGGIEFKATEIELATYVGSCGAAVMLEIQ